MNLLQREKRSLSSFCKLLGYSRQAYYKNLKSLENECFQSELIVQQVLCFRIEQPKIGCRKLHHLLEGFLQERNISIGRDALFELLREHHLLVRRRSRKPITTYSRHWLHKYPNLIEHYVPTRPCQIWVSDITYIRVGTGFAYLSLITDAYSRMIVGFYLSENLGAYGCLQALRMALLNNPIHNELIHHSDRGIQYCSYEYTNLLHTEKIKISMTQKGDPIENAIAERLNGILKMELLQERYTCFEGALGSIEKAIGIYNVKRPHSSIDMLTPSLAHLRSGTLERRWKSYYKKHTSEKEVIMV